MATSELMSVDFHGDTILATRGPDGTILVAVKRVCESLGLDFASQMVRLKKVAWGGVVQITTPDSRGVEQKTYVIPADRLPMWLVGVVAGRVREDVRPKLIAYQLEAAAVLARHFLGMPPPAVPVLRPWSERIMETWQPHYQYLSIHHPDCFTAVSALGTQMLCLEDELIRHLLTPTPSDRPDVSVGLCWANDRRARGLPPAAHAVPLWLPNVAREVRLCVYPNEERGAFEVWFAARYLTEKLAAYLTHKPAFRGSGELTTSSVADNTCRKLAGRPAELSPPVRRRLREVGGFAPAGTQPPALEDRKDTLFALMGR